MSQFDQVIAQIEQFIKKFYKNQMLKGVMLFLAFLICSYGLVTTLEYFGRFGSGVRLALLIGFVGGNVFLLGKFLIIPLMKLYKVGKHLSVLQASEMIGRIFPEVGDKLKNTILLNDDSTSKELNIELVKASIEQRSAQLSIIPFTSGIDLSENKKYLKFLLPVLALFLTIVFVNPDMLLDGSERVMNFNTEFEEPAPFEFILDSKDEVKEGENYLLKIKLKGNDIPDEVKIFSSQGTYNLKKKSKVEFQYEFKNITKDLVFYCEGNGFKSQEYLVRVLKKPVLEELSLTVIYPKHTKRKKEVFNNTGDITIPEGSIVEWKVRARNLKELIASFRDTSISLMNSVSKQYNFKRQFFNSERYTLTVSSEEVKNADSLNYNIAVVQDEYPSIDIIEKIDSTNSLKRFIEGKISDDYGFRSLNGRLKVSGKDTSYTINKSIRINPDNTSQLFSYYFDFSTLDLKPGYKVEYSFAVTDNDELNGYKTTVSGRKVYAVPDLDQLDNQLTNESEKIKNELDEALKESEELKKRIAELRAEMLNKPNLDWRDKQNLENLIQQHQELNDKIEKLNQEYQEHKNERDNFLEESEELKEKEAQLEELLEELMDEELMELFKELQEMLENMNQEELLDHMEKMEQETEDLEMKMDRMMEMFKNMQLDQKLENIEDQLSELKEEQDELQEMTENKEFSNEELAAKQDSINKKWDEIKKDMDEAEEMNENLESPRDVDFDDEKKEQLDQELNDAKENLEQNKSGKAQKNQGKASEMMQEMSDDVSSMQSMQMQQQQGEDMASLRFLLENLINLSHQQEGLMDEYAVTSPTDPYYKELNRKQQNIQASTKIVNDSLHALSKRVWQLSGFITEELSNLNYNLDQSAYYSEEGNTSKLGQHQQYSMTSYNELALMLADVLDQMQQQAQAQMQGEGSCNKPGGNGQGSPSMSFQEMKDAMKQQMERMKGGQKPGGEEGENSQGDGKGKGMGFIPGLSREEQAKMAMEQGRIRESLQQLKEDLNKDGSGFGNLLDDLINDLDQLEKDLLNGEVGENYWERHADIYTRLLESEKAIRERGFSEERESQEGKNPEEGNQIEFTEYNKKKNAEIEFLRSLPVGLQVYYKTLVNEYFNSVNN